MEEMRKGKGETQKKNKRRLEMGMGRASRMTGTGEGDHEGGKPERQAVLRDCQLRYGYTLKYDPPKAGKRQRMGQHPVVWAPPQFVLS